MKKLLVFILCALGVTNAYSVRMKISDIYEFAKQNKSEELATVTNINGHDMYRNTALCLAIKDENVAAYKLLLQYGANPNHECVKRIPAEQYDAFMKKLEESERRKFFSGFGKWGWGAIGAAIIGGATVAALSGGGGGGDSSSQTNNQTDTTDNDSEPNQPENPATSCQDLGYTATSCAAGYTVSSSCVSGNTTYVQCVFDDINFIEQGGQIYPRLNCVNGTQSANSCICTDGWVGDLCDTPAPCVGFTDTSCTGAYEESGATCKSGDITYVQCQPIQCGSNAHWEGTACVCDSGYGGWTYGTGCTPIPLDCGSNAHQVGTNCICDTGYQYNGTECVYYLELVGEYTVNQQTDDDIKLIAITNNTANDGPFDVTFINTGNGDIIFNTTDGSITQLTIDNSTPSLPFDNLTGFYDPVTTEYYEQSSVLFVVPHGDFYGTNSVNTDLFLNVDDTEPIYVNFTTGLVVPSIQENKAAYLMYGDDLRNLNVSGHIHNNGSIVVESWLTFYGGDVPDAMYDGIYGMYDTTPYQEGLDSRIYNTYVQDLDLSGLPADNDYSNVFNVFDFGGGIYLGYTGLENMNIYGMYSHNNLYSIYFSNTSDNDYSWLEGDPHFYSVSSSISVYNSSGTAYGMYSDQDVFSGVVFDDRGTISYITDEHPPYSQLGPFHSDVSMRLEGPGTSYGLYAGHDAYNGLGAEIYLETDPASWCTGTIYGIFAENNAYNYGYITGRHYGEGVMVGMYTHGGTAINSDFADIDITNDGSGSAIGIFGDENSTIINNGEIRISGGPNSKSFGIYAKSGSEVTNSGIINIENVAENAYGIYAETGASVSNSGTINISCTGSTCSSIYLNGATLYNAGVIAAPQMSLSSFGGNVIAGPGSQFVIENELSGDLDISSEIVAQGNQTQYIAQNMIDAGDVSGLNVRSASAMFNASLADNGHDVVMQMKDFNSLTDNASLAAFLKNNYDAGNGSDLFATLKSMENMSAFNGTLSGLTGLNTFTQFAHEDLSAMREISFSMNNKLFENSNRDNFDISDSMGYFSFSDSRNGGNGQYGISSEKISDNWKLGYGMAMANLYTNDGDGLSRQNKMWLFYMPATYTNDGYELVIAPKAGFAHSEYNRRGYNNVNYEGYIEKTIFGLMNDLRYPLTFGNWTIAPDVAFNTIVYDQTGHENEQEFSLVIPDDKTVSVETGFGFYTKYEKAFNDGSRLKLNSGLMAYREFGDTYDIKLGIRGMDGTFNLYNNDYKYRGAASIGFDYMMGNLHLYGNAQYFMDNANYMNFKSGVSYRF